MAKADKKNGKKEHKKKEPETAEPAAQPRGRLVALEGVSGALLRPEAARLAGFCSGEHDPAWSLWDASNTFYEMRMVKSRFLTPTPRALLLLYASDLLFRLRWEIEPTLAEGRNVVAAPYVESAIAFGLAAGMPRDWMEELFSFAPKPAASYRLKEKKKLKVKAKEKEKKGAANSKANGNGAALAGFVEFFCSSLSRQFPGWELADVRAAMIQYLKELEEKEQIHTFGKKPHQIKRALT